jgi:catechol 2,3-dioxygenase-like lactoylglutathione lyase family enzyme
MHIKAVNHVALHVADVAESVAFYGQVLDLQPMPRPAFDFPGAWFRIGTDQELHLIGDRTEAVRSHSRGTHFALHVPDVHAADGNSAKRAFPSPAPNSAPTAFSKSSSRTPTGITLSCAR